MEDADTLVVVVDDEHRENEADLVLAAELATPETVALMIREARVAAARRHGVGTDVSAADRATTARLAVDKTADDLTCPGHLFPLTTRTSTVLVQRGHTEAAIDLVTAAGRSPLALTIGIISDDGEMLRGDELTQFATGRTCPSLQSRHSQRTAVAPTRDIVLVPPSPAGA